MAQNITKINKSRIMLCLNKRNYRQNCLLSKMKLPKYFNKQAV